MSLMTEVLCLELQIILFFLFIDTLQLSTGCACNISVNDRIFKHDVFCVLSWESNFYLLFCDLCFEP